MVSKTRDYTKKEWAALDDKLYNPKKDVKCPRCGNQITYAEIGNSTSVKCITQNCIFGGSRGL